MPDGVCLDRLQGCGGNTKTAVLENVKTLAEFEINKSNQHKRLIAVASDRYLKQVK